MHPALSRCPFIAPLGAALLGACRPAGEPAAQAPYDASSAAEAASPTPNGAPPDSPPPGTDAASPSPASPASSQQAEGAMCGGIAGIACADGLYCAFPLEARCGAADQSGTCSALPEMCTEQYEPVCGCDDKTYSNACHAAREGVSVGREGECAPSSP